MARKGSFPSAVVSPTTPQAPFDINLPKRHASYDRSSPRTPPSPNNRAVVRGKGKVKGSRNRPALPESFQGENARGDIDGYNRKRSDSHELTFSPRQARASVVDNMLLSLDQSFMNAGPPSRDLRGTDASVSATNFYNTPLHLTGSRPCGHTYSSSISCEADYLRDEAGSRGSNQPNQPTRRHRSNSSSNFQSALRRIDSIRATEEEKAKDKGYQPQRSIGPDGSTNTRPSTKRKSSKSSGTSSLDLGQMIGNPRWQRAIERRSASFDHGYRPAFTFETNIIGQQPASAALPGSFPYDNDDAAPTPTIRAGPRRDNPSPGVAGFPLQSPRTLAQTLPLRRRGSKKSPATLFSRHDKGDTTDIIGTRDMKRSRVHTRANSQEAAVSAVTANGFSLSHAMASRRPSMAPPQGGINPQKERPGFFRRVFGSSRNTTPTSQDAQSPQTRPYGSVSTTRTESRNGQLSNGTPSNGPPKSSASGNSATNMAKETPPATLNKKASFFRRRKKSVSEGIPLPVPPLEFRPEFQPRSQVLTVEASPVSSLRKVMDPYLSSPVNLSHPCGVNSLARAGSEPSRFPEPVELDQLLHNSPPHTPNSTSDHVGTHGEQSAPLSMRDNPSGSERATSISKLANDSSPSNISNKEINQVRDNSHDAAVEAKGAETTMNYGSAGSGQTADAQLGKENQPSSVKGSHARSGSNKELPKFPPRELAPLAIRDSNVQSPSLHGCMPTRTTSKDWNGSNILLRPTKEFASASHKASTPRSQRVWLHPTASEEELRKSTKLPHESHESIVSDYKSATSKLATPEVELSPQAPIVHDEPQPISDVPQPDDSEPTADEQAQAKRIFDGIDDDVVDTASAAAWLGDAGAERAGTRKAYLELFDWQGINILAALRNFCNRLLLKGETQQVDRILDAFSTRWCVCNPNHGFKATGMCFLMI